MFYIYKANRGKKREKDGDNRKEKKRKKGGIRFEISSYPRYIFFSSFFPFAMSGWADSLRIELLPRIQPAKILLLSPKYEIIMVPSNYSNVQYCDSNIGLFSIAP